MDTSRRLLSVENEEMTVVHIYTHELLVVQLILSVTLYQDKRYTFC